MRVAFARQVLISVAYFFVACGVAGAQTSADLVGCDFDGDGVTDEGTVKRAKSVTVRLLDSDGSVRESYSVPFGRRYSPSLVSCQDIDGDARAEILVTKGNKVIQKYDVEKFDGDITACKRYGSFPSGFIYKTVGSNHFSDCRRSTIGLIMRNGTSGPFPSVISIYSLNGTKLGAVGLYSRNDGWAARYYSCVGGGQPAQSGSRLAQKAKQASGSTKVYLNRSGTCYGPIEANKCVGSKQC